MPWTPADYIELVKAMFYGVGAVCVPLITAYIMLAAARAKRAEDAALKNAASLEAVNTKIDGMLVERDKANVKVGRQQEKIVGEERAATLAQGQSEGRAEAIALAAATPSLVADPKQPIPVTDDRTATATEMTAEATGRLADATVKIADAAGKK